MRKFFSPHDFSSLSDINWTCPIAVIGEKLYNKSGLTKPERVFIESMIKPME